MSLRSALVLSLTIFVTSVLAQRPGGRGGGRFAEMEKRALAEGFQGLATDGKIEKGLFPIGSTGVSTEPVRKAAEAFLAGLSAEQKKKTLFPVDDTEWRKWANQHSYVRQGIGFNEMDEKQRELAFALIGSGLSAEGLRTTRDIMKLNATLGELTGRAEEYNEWLYWVTILGEPSATKPWGWQLDGHHVVINYFVLGDQVVMTPHFYGSEPIRAEGGKFQGAEVMQAEEKAGRAFMNSLSAEHQKLARVADAKGPTNNLTEAFKDNVDLAPMGILGSQLDAAAKKGLVDLAAVFIGQMSEGHAKVKVSEIEKHIDRTRFAWMGAAGPDDVFYFRIHSPVVLIEFDHQRPIALARNQTPTLNHIHAVVRTPNGNDYGKDLLRQHYDKAHK